MKIPDDLQERENFYQEVIKKCTSSQQDRANDYSALRQYYLFGGETIDSSPFNKIYPHVDLLTSFLYASETTKFAVHLGATAKEHEYGRVPKLARSVNDRWLDSNADRVVSEAITWALVDNTRIVKLLPKVNKTTKKLDGIYPYSVHPANFGVYREDVSMLDRQEAMVESYYTTKSQLEIDLANHPQRAAILASVQSNKGRELEEDNQTGVGKLMASTQQPLVAGTTAMGNVDFWFSSRIDYIPDLDEHELITMDELWVWDTAKGDYRMVTRVRDGMTIYDRIASEHHIFLAGEHPYVQFCPRPLPFYFWGMSEVAGLCNLQEWYNERIMQIRKLLNLQVYPPTAASGFGATADEKMFASFMEGGFFNDGGQGVQPGKLERFPPTLPQDLFTVLREIDSAFSDHSGLPNTVQGKGEVGVRSGKQTSELARLGSARIKKRALVIEDSLEKMATLYLKLMRKYDNTVYEDDTGTPFTAEQFTDDFVVKVDAHSNSPIFVEDKKELAFSMLEQKMITRERAVEMIDPVDKEIIKRELKTIEAQEAAAAKEQEKIALATGKHHASAK